MNLHIAHSATNRFLLGMFSWLLVAAVWAPDSKQVSAPQSGAATSSQKKSPDATEQHKQQGDSAESRASQERMKQSTSPPKSSGASEDASVPRTRPDGTLTSSAGFASTETPSITDPTVKRSTAAGDSALPALRGSGGASYGPGAEPANVAPTRYSRLLTTAIAFLVIAAGVLIYLLVQVRTLIRTVSGDLAEVKKRVEQPGSPHPDAATVASLTVKQIESLQVFQSLSKSLPKIQDAVREIRAHLAKGGGGPLPQPTPSPSSQGKQSTSEWPQWEQSPTAISPNEALRALATDCIRSPMTQTQLRARLQPGWTAEGYAAGGERPEGFIIHTADGEHWLVPNTKSWKAFRGKRYFHVHGHDSPQSLITGLTAVARVRPNRGTYDVIPGGEGQVELSIG